MSGARVLVVDDDPAILRSVRRALDAHGYRVETRDHAAGVVAAVRDFRPEVVLLDLVLPDGDGIGVCRAIRTTEAVPIIVLSAVGDDRRKVEALDEGADDYLTKPFSMDELLARIRVALRRTAGQARETVLRAGPIALNVATHEVMVAGIAVHLTPKEFDLLRLLLQEQGRVLTPRIILSRVWGPEYIDDAHILRTFVHQLRGKLEAACPGAGAIIVNDPGVGYRLVPPQS
jgi:two-component system KDP operon response regulator KdpE